MAGKLEDANQAGAHLLTTACTYCQMQFDAVQADHLSEERVLVPAVLYTQLLGMAMGLPDELLGLKENRIQWTPDTF